LTDFDEPSPEALALHDFRISKYLIWLYGEGDGNGGYSP
jgi:hypothetical protein